VLWGPGAAWANSKTATERGSSGLETARQPLEPGTGGAQFRELVGPFEHDPERLGPLLGGEACARPGARRTRRTPFWAPPPPTCETRRLAHASLAQFADLFRSSPSRFGMNQTPFGPPPERKALAVGSE